MGSSVPARGPTSRREFLMQAGAVGMAPVLGATALRDETIVERVRREAASAEVRVTPLRGRLHLLEGSGGNIAVHAGAGSTLLVDAGFPASRTRIERALRELGAAPVRHLVDTHWHFDHTDGNAWLHEAGATIVAHVNTRRRMRVSTHVAGWQHTFPPSPAAAIPEDVFEQEHRLLSGDEVVELRHYEAGHTDTDVSVRFTRSDVLVTGDTWWNGHYPFIDYSTGGSIGGAIRAAAANVTLARPDTLVVPGHGPAGGRADLLAFREMLLVARERVGALKARGATLAEVVAARPMRAYDETWGTFLITPATFVALVYQGV